MVDQAQLAGRLEQAFGRFGFAELSVADLRAAAAVSLRTLYRYFPSKDAMVIGALEHRQARYVRFLAEGAPPPGAASVTHLFDRLGEWMRHEAPNGCLSMHALAAFPDNVTVREAVVDHKRAIVGLMARRSGRDDVAEGLFLLHEGASAAWPLQGEIAIQAAKRAAVQLLDGGQP